MIVAMDRDNTVSTSDGPVPLEWVQELAHQRGLEVWAFGNQRLRLEADIPGETEMCRRIPGRTRIAKPDRLEILRTELFPNESEYVVVDDGDYSYIDGWVYYTPTRFVEENPFACSEGVL